MSDILDTLSDEELELLLQEKQADIQTKGPSSLDDLSDQDLEMLFKMKAEEEVAGPESALRGVAQGVTLGFADEISGAVESAFTDKSYEQARDESRANFEVARAANPAAFLSGEVVGGIASGIASGGLGAGLKGAAVLGTIAGVGNSEEDEIEKQLTDAMVGGTLGVAGHGIGSVLGKGANRIAKAFRETVEEEADALGLKAVGVFTKTSRKKLAKKLESKRMTVDEFLNIFENETTVAGKPLIRLGGTQQELLEDVLEKQGQIGDEMGTLLKDIDLAAEKTGRKAIRSKEFADHLEEEMDIARLLNSPNADEAALGARLAKRIARYRESDIEWSLMDVHNEKVRLANKANFLRKENTDLQFNSQLRKMVTKTNDFIHDKVNTLSQSPDSLSKFRDLKRRFGVLADAEEFIEDSVQAEKDGLLGSVRKAIGAAMGTGGLTVAGGVIGGVPGAALGAALTIASKSPKVNLGLSKTLQKVGLHLSNNPANERYLSLMATAAGRGNEAFHSALRLIEANLDGFIIDPEEEAMYRGQVKSSRLPTREKMRMMAEINSGIIPTPPAQPQEPVHRVFIPRPRNENGRKI